MKKSITLLLIVSVFLFSVTDSMAQGGADSLLHFILQNKPKASLLLEKDNTVMAHLHEHTLMPLASTVKIIVAIEFSKQAAYHRVDVNKMVPLSDLDKYYIAHTDGDAHPHWISYEKQQGNIINDSVSLLEVAKGMMLFSSNANTEYLMDLLGIDNVNSNIKLLGVKDHTIIYPLVSSLFLYQNPRHTKEEKIIKQIEKFSDEQYARATLLIHDQLKNDSTYKGKFRLQDLTAGMQKEWSDRLPASTTEEYVRICNILNNRKIFDEKTYAVLSQILETIMQNPTNREWLSHAGMKGGSTMFVLTKALYATLKNGTKIELAYFFNNLSQEENDRLQKWMNDFELAILSSDDFRKKVAESLN
ncbi:MAG: serine hydrolase [Ginsengibacter sp.]